MKGVLRSRFARDDGKVGLPVAGPLTDRIDLHIEAPQMKFREIASEQAGEDRERSCV